MESGVIKEGRKHRSTRCFLSLWEKKEMATKNNKRQKKKNGASVQELLGIKAFTDYGIQTNRGELLFFKVRPTNISVLSQPSVETKIRQLTLVLGEDILSDPNSDIEAEVQTRYFTEKLRAALLNLPDEERALIKKHFFDGLPLMHLDGERQKENRLAVHQPLGLRKKVLP